MRNSLSLPAMLLIAGPPSVDQSCAYCVAALAAKRFLEMELCEKFEELTGTFHQLRVREGSGRRG
jgi:hypothetical protein